MNNFKKLIKEALTPDFLKEGVDREIWNDADDETRMQMVVDATDDSDLAEKYFDRKWDELPPEISNNLRESQNSLTEYDQTQGREEYRDMDFEVLYSPEDGYSIESGRWEIINPNAYFSTYAEAIEHAEIEIDGYLGEGEEDDDLLDDIYPDNPNLAENMALSKELENHPDFDVLVTALEDSLGIKIERNLRSGTYNGREGHYLRTPDVGTWTENAKEMITQALDKASAKAQDHTFEFAGISDYELEPGERSWDAAIEFFADKEEDDDEMWIDPAGGTHYGDDDDPAASYMEESIDREFHSTKVTSGHPKWSEMSAEEIQDYIDANPDTLWGRSLSTAKMVRDQKQESVNEGKLPAEDELKRLGIKYELSGNKYKPFKKIFKPTDKSDKFYKEFDDVIWRYNLSSAVESVNEVKIKKQIREEIIRILSEGMTADEWADAQEEARPLSEEEIDAIYDNFIDTNKYKETVIDDPDGTKENAILKIDTPDGKSYKVLTNAEDDEKWWKWGDIREEEMTDDEMEKKAEKEAKSKEAEKISDVKDDVAKQQKMLKKVKDVMKDRAKDYKKAEGKEKDNIKTELKALTSGKKQIEAKIKKLDKQL